MYANTAALNTHRDDLAALRSPVPDPRCEWIAKHLSYRTGDLAQAQAHLRSLDASVSLRIHNARGFREYRESTHVPIGTLALAIGCIDAAEGYELAFQTRDEYLINMPLRGSGRICAGGSVLDLDSRQVLFIGPHCRVVKHWRGPGQVLNLHMPKQTLHRALRDRGTHIGSLPLDAATLFGRAQLRPFLNLLNMVCADLADGRSTLCDPVIAEHCERLMMSLLVGSLPLRGQGDRLDAPSRATPHYIQRAQDYMRANATESLNTASIAAAAGVSPRALQYGFRRHCESTPMLFLKRVRLERARAALSGGGSGRRRVSDVAADIGCFNMSQFSRDYKAMFGETPSQTAAAQKMLAVGAIHRSAAQSCVAG